ncbi:MAG: tetratricopeptide repeat protein, partial [Acidobacteriota bacterium]
NEAVKAYNEGAAAYEARDLAKAKELFLKAVAADAALPQPYLVLADLYLTEGAHQEAAEAAEQFLALQPGDRNAQMLAYEAYQELGNQAKIDELRSILGETEAAPQLAIQVFNEGAIANQKGDLNTAIEKFKASLELDPNLAEAHAALGAVYYNQQQYDEALASIGKTLELKPDHLGARRTRFLVHDARNDRTAADEAMASYIEVDASGAAQLLYQRADLDFRAGERALARIALTKVLELDPEMPRAHYTLGLIYSADDTAKAKMHFEKFIALAPDDPEVATAKEMLAYF